ncbi:MFS transporter [Subtercola frigoramans]|uniref:MFS family permease n=1 Tax=Subtercola frigoramans TaxID=120298 RepID=A0ABS2LAF2_9MICO|nr:MFS transporter [Subtercola frigoramans]MBM7473461.1 MFS family permease [Subtercola frigoramans]
MASDIVETEGLDPNFVAPSLLDETTELAEESGNAPEWQALPEIVSSQARSVKVLIAAQIFGSFGMGASASVAILLAQSVIDSEALAGVARTSLTLGAAVFGIPLAILATRRGRRFSLSSGWALGAVGALVLVLAAILSSAVLLIAGMLLFGAGTATGLQTRFSATDMALPKKRGRTLSYVVWFGLFGSVLGPNLGFPGEYVARWLGLPLLAGAFVLAALLLAVAAVLTLVFLRPDPLKVAQSHHAAAARVAAGANPVPATTVPSKKRGAFRTVLPAIWSIPTARFALIAVVVSHVSMVSLMTMTPVFMEMNGATVTLVGITISVHVLGMFAFAPLVGWASDRLGAPAVIVIGQVIFLGSAIAAIVIGPESTMLTPSLFLLGLGWSCGTVPGSILLSSSVPTEIRTTSQGVVDAVMNAVAALAALCSGPVFVLIGFSGLAIGVIILAAIVLATALVLPRAAWLPRS